MAVASGFGTPTLTVPQVVEHIAESFRAFWLHGVGSDYCCRSVPRPFDGRIGTLQPYAQVHVRAPPMCRFYEVSTKLASAVDRKPI
jgi:hypothetical protein